MNGKVTSYAFYFGDGGVSVQFSGYGTTVVTLPTEYTDASDQTEKVKRTVNESEFNAAIDFSAKNFAMKTVSPGVYEDRENNSYYYQLEDGSSESILISYDGSSWEETRQVIKKDGDGNLYAVYTGSGTGPFPDEIGNISWNSLGSLTLSEWKQAHGIYADLAAGIALIDETLDYSLFSYDSSSEEYTGTVDYGGNQLRATLIFADGNLMKAVFVDEDDNHVTITFSRYGDVTAADVEDKSLNDYLQSPSISAERFLKLMKETWDYMGSISRGLRNNSTFTAEWVRVNAANKSVMNAVKNEVKVYDDGSMATFTQYEKSGSASYSKTGEYRVLGFGSGHTEVKNNYGNYGMADDSQQFSYSNSTPVGQAFAMCLLRFEQIKGEIPGSFTSYSASDYTVSFKFGDNVTVTAKYEYNGEFVLKEFVYKTANATIEETFTINNISI